MSKYILNPDGTLSVFKNEEKSDFAKELEKEFPTEEVDEKFKDDDFTRFDTHKWGK